METTNITFKIIFLGILFTLLSCKTTSTKQKEPLKNVNFTKEYISYHQNTFVVEIPVVHELANILVAISNVGKIDSNMVDMTTDYYKTVREHFDKYSNHPLLDSINNYIVKPLDNESYYYYFTLKMDACAYKLKKGKLENTGFIKKLSWDFYEDPFKKHQALFEDFAEKSGFDFFYTQNQDYYNDLIATYRALNPVGEIQSWLQNKFGKSYGGYKAVFSPLVGGAHAANQYSDNGFEQTYMFIARSEYEEGISKEMNIISSARVLFTEIDHHFINPVSETKMEQLNQVFNNRAYWVNDETPGTTAYPDGFSIFNEYMTWGLYSLYIYDKYSVEEVEKYIPTMESQMEKSRGFIRFKSFNRELIKKWKQNPDIDIHLLLNDMIKWSSKQQ